MILIACKELHWHCLEAKSLFATPPMLSRQSPWPNTTSMTLTVSLNLITRFEFAQEFLRMLDLNKLLFPGSHSHKRKGGECYVHGIHRNWVFSTFDDHRWKSYSNSSPLNYCLDKAIGLDCLRIIVYMYSFLTISEKKKKWCCSNPTWD